MKKDFESYYGEKLELEDEKLIEGLKQGKNIKELEKSYIKNTRKLREGYNKAYRVWLKTADLLEKEKKEKQEENDKIKEFKVEALCLDFTRKERMKLKFSVAKFKFRRNLRHFFDKNLPNFFVRFYFHSRLKNRLVFTTIKNILNKIGNFFKNVFLGIIKFFKNSFIKINEKFEKINKKFSKKKGKDGKQSETKPEEKPSE